MSLHRRAIEFALAAAVIAPLASAQQAPADGAALPRSFVHVGGSFVRHADKGETSVGGVVDPQAKVRTDDIYSPNLEAGIFVTDDVAIALALSMPVKTKNYAAGSLEGLGNLGTDTSGFATLDAQWRFNRGGRWEPYVGAGVGLFHNFSTEDGLVQDLSIDDAVGSVVRAGVDLNLTRHWSLYLDVKKMFVETKANGTIAGARIDSTAILDPLLVSAGLGFRY
jgi:outer membrane protein